LPSVGPGAGAGGHHKGGRDTGGAAHQGLSQAAASRIIVNAHRINLGLMPELAMPVDDSDFYFVPPDEKAADGRFICT
jgi:exodeoxyribonuclease V alpha subunit